MAISFSGLASGLDTASWVTSLTALKQAKVTTLQTQVEKVISARDTLANIKSFFSTFRSKIEKITDSKFNIATMDIFSKKVAQTSAAAKVTATAKADAAEGTYEVKVNQLATNTQVQSGYRYKTQVVTTTQAVDMSYLKHMGITAGEVKVQHAGVLSSINIEENDKMTDLLQKFRDKGIEASFNNSTGVFSFDVGIEGIWDTGMTGFVDKLKLVGVNYGYQNENQLNIEDVETIYHVADNNTKLTDLGITTGTENSKIKIEANGQEYTFALEENDTMGSLLEAMQAEHIQVDLTDGIFTIRDAVITDDGDTGFIAALGLSEEVSNVAQSTDGLQYHTVYLETSVATGDSYIKDLNGVNFEAGQTVVVKNRDGNSTTISLNEGAKIDDLLSGMRTAGLTVDFTDGVLTVDNGWITGGTFDIEGTFGLEYTTTPAIVTGSSLNQTITTHETATLSSKLVGDLGATTGNVKITDAGGTAHLFNVTNDSTLQDFINAVDSYGLSATYDGVTGVVTLHGGAYESITGGSNLYNVMFGSDTPAASSYNSASSVSQELKVRTTQTVQMTGATALSALGITNQTVTFNESTTIAINNSWTMDQLVTHLREDIGLDASFDSATGKLTVENATIKGSTGNFAEKMGFEETITGRYVTSNTLVGQTVTIGVDLTSNGAVLVETGTVTGTSTAGQSTTGGSINIVTTTTVGQTQTGTQITYNSVSESTSTTETVITTPGEATISTVGQSQTGNVSGYDYSVTTTALTQTGATMSYISVGSTQTVITIPGTTTVSTTGLSQTGGVVTYVTYSIQQGQTTQTSTTEMTYGSLTTAHATNSLEGGALSQSIVTTTTQGQTFVTGVLSYKSQDYKSSNTLINLASAPISDDSTISTVGLGYTSSGYSTISVSGNWVVANTDVFANPGTAYNLDNLYIQQNNNWVDLSSHWGDTVTIIAQNIGGGYTSYSIQANHSYAINDANDLQYLIDLAKTTDLTGYQFKLNADINAADIQYGVIMNGFYSLVAATVNMKGTIDGNGHKITGCDRALFDSFQGTIQNVQFENATISASVTGSQGVLAKTISGSTTVSNVKFTSCSVTTTDWDSAAGMVAGTVSSGATVTIDNAEISSSNIQVQGYYAGGLIGFAKSSSGNTTVNVTDTKVSNTTIKSSGATGALLGVAKYVNINHCSITQIKSEGGTLAGGVIGSATGGTITSVATQYTSVHAGYNLDGTVVDYSDWIKAGGFAGEWGTGRIEHCYMTSTTVTNACTASTAQTAGFCNFSSTSNNFYFEDCVSNNVKVSSANGMTAGFATAGNGDNAHFTSCKITGTSTSIGSSATDTNLTVAGFWARGSYTASTTATFDSCFVRANAITGCSTAGFMDVATNNNTIRNCATYVTNNNASSLSVGTNSSGFVRKALGGSFTSIKVQGTTTGSSAYGFCQTMSSSATVNDVEILGTISGTGHTFNAGYAYGFGGTVSGNISTVKIGANIAASGDVSVGQLQYSSSAYGFGNVVSGNISSVNITGTMSGTVVKGFSGAANSSNTTIKCCWTSTTNNVDTTSAQAFLASSSNTATASTTDMLYYGSRRIAIGNNAKVRDVMGLPDEYQLILGERITLTDGTYYELDGYSTVAEIKSYLNSKGIDLVGTAAGGNSIITTGTTIPSTGTKVMSISGTIKDVLCVTENTASSAQFTDIASATTKLSVLGVSDGTYTITKTSAGADPNTVSPTTFKVTVNADTTVGSLVQAFTNQGITSSIGDDGKITVGSDGTSVLMGAASGLSGILCNASNTISANTTNNLGVTYNITTPTNYNAISGSTEIGQLTKQNSGSALITSDQTFVVTNADNSKETITVHTTDTVDDLVTMLNQNGVDLDYSGGNFVLSDANSTDGSYISYMSSDLTKLFTTNNTTASTSMTSGYCTYAVQTTVTTAQTLGDAGLASGQYTIATTNGTITVNQNTTFATLIDEFSNKLEAADLNSGHVIVTESLSKKITGFSNDTIRDFLGLVITDAENFDLNLTSSINTATTSTTMNTLGVVGNTYVTIYNGTTNVVKTIAETDTIADVVTKLNDVLGSGGVKFNTSGSNIGKISIAKKGSKYITGMSQSLQTALNITVGMNNTYKEQIRTTAATKTTLVSQTTDTVLANQNTTLGQLGFFEGDPTTVAKSVSSKSLQYQTGTTYYNAYDSTCELNPEGDQIDANTNLFDLINPHTGSKISDMLSQIGENSLRIKYSNGDYFTIEDSTTIGDLITNFSEHVIDLDFLGPGSEEGIGIKYGTSGTLDQISDIVFSSNTDIYIESIIMSDDSDATAVFFNDLLGCEIPGGELVQSSPVYSNAAGNMKLSETNGWAGGFTLTTGAGETIAVDSNTTINGLVSSLQAANINASYSNGQIRIANGDYENYNGYIASTSSSSNMNSLLGNIITSKTIYPDVGETGYINLMDGTTIEVTNKTSLKTIVQNLNANGINTTTAAYIDDNHRINLTEGSTNAILSISANLAGILGWNSGYGETYTTEQGDVINATAGTALSQFGITGNVTIVTNTGNITLANTAVISTTGEAADDSSIVKALAAHGITASFNESTHQFTIEGNSDNYIISMDPILQSVLGINTGNGTTYNVNVSYGDSTTTTITQTQTVYHTYRNTATADTTFGELGFAEEELGYIMMNDGDALEINGNMSIGDVLNWLNGQIEASIDSGGCIQVVGANNRYIQSMTSNVANALRIEAGFGETYTTNVDSTSATTATTLAALGMTSNGVIHTTNGDITINATDNIAAIQSALTAKGITSSLTNGQFSLGGASDTGVVTGMSANLSAALGNISTGLNFSYTTAAVEGTTEVTVSASDTLERLGINSNSSIVITGDNGGTINLTKDTTVQQLMDAFNSHGYTASLNSGVLSLRANGNNFIASDSNDVLSHFNISGNTYSETDKTLGQTKITDLRDSSGNALNISAGKVKVVQNGIEKTLTIETTDTLDTLNSKLANYGISMSYGLGHDGSISFTTTGDTYLSTYTGSGASDFLAKIGANNTWDTNKNINSQTLEYITNPDNVISTATKVTELRDASGNSLGITAGTYQVVSNGVTVNKTITNDTTVADMFADLSLYGISASIDSSGKISLGAASNTYLKYDGNSGESNVVNVLFNDWTMGNVYTSNHLDVEKTPTVTANRETKLSEIAGGNYQAGTLTVSDQVAGTTATITLGANETVGSFMDTLTLHGFNSYLNSSGQLVIQNNGDKTILTPAVGGSNAMSVLGLDTSNWEQPGHYAGSVSSQTVEHGIDVAADRDTLLSTLGITAGKFYVFSNGVRHEVDMSSDETIGSLFETLNSYGLHTTLKKDGNYSTIIIQGTGDSYIAKSNSVGASNIADVLNIQTAKQYNYNGDLQTTEYVTHTIVASNETFLSDYDKTVNDSVQHSEGTFAFEVDGEYNELHITSFETFGSLLEKFNRVGVKATLNDGTLRLETGNRSFNVITDATDSHLLSNLGLEYSEDLGGFCASSESLTQTITTLEDRNLSVANYADMNTQLSLLNISTGNLAIYRDGKKASIEVNANETLGQLRSRISSAFSDVDIKVEDGHLTFFSTDDAVVQVGSSVDTTNFSAICGFVENEDGTVTSAKELYKINAMSRVMDAGLFRKSTDLIDTPSGKVPMGDVTAGTFNIGDDTFTIDENTTIASIIAQINSSEKSNASAYWDSVDGKMVITARTTGSSLVNIEAGTSNFTDLLGLTNTDRNDDGSVQVTRLARDAQAVGKNSNFTINGTRFSSTSNIITSDISRINGITFNLKAASDETITITVDKDKEAATTAMQEFVDAYNELVTAVDEEVSKEGALSDQFTLKSIRNQIRSLVTSTFAGNSAFRNLSAIGISTVTASSGNISTTGIDTLFLDTEKFLEQYAKDPDSVKKLLVGDDTTNGILMQVENVVENALTSVSGYFSSADNSFAKTIQNLNDKISRANKSVEAYRARLENKFQSMDMLISKMQNQYDSFLGQQ